MKIVRPIKVGKVFIYRGPIQRRCDMASRPNLSCAEIDEISADPSAEVRIRVAHRNDLLPATVRTLLNDIDRHVRFAVLNNEKIEISLGLLWAVVDNKKEEDYIQRKALERLIEGDDEYLRHTQYKCEITSKPVFIHTEIDEVINDDSVIMKIRVAHRNDLSQENVRNLLNDIDRNVRFAILSNDRVEISLGKLWTMSDEDEEDFIRKKALERLIEGNDEEVCIPSIFFVFISSI